MALRLNRGRVGIALLIVLGVAILCGNWAGDNRYQRLVLQKAPVLGQVELSRLDDEQPLIVEGVVSPTTPAVISNLAAACEELYWSEEGESGWEDENELPGTVQIQVSPDLNVPVLLDDPCALPATGDYYYDPANSGRRFRGVYANDRLTIIADVTSLTPLALDAERVFRGSRADFLKDLESDRILNSLLAGLLLLIAAGVGLWPKKGAPAAPRQRTEATKASKTTNSTNSTKTRR